MRLPSIETVFIEGKFVEAEDWTVWTEDVDLATGELTSSFILERLPDGSQRIISAASGALVRQNGTISEIQLEAGMGADLSETKTLSSRLEFDSFWWRPPDALTQFRARGKDVRELMLWELWAPAIFVQDPDHDNIEPLEATVSIHDQLARFALILILPLIAVPFGLSYGRHPPSNAILIGLLTLIIIQQLLELAKSLALDGVVPAWAGSWAVIIIVGVSGILLFLRSAVTMAQPPLSSVPAIRLPRFLSSKSDPERPAS
ncbi:MAG: LptF/LptG family permease [Pseudomonadota bacterium]